MFTSHSHESPPAKVMALVEARHPAPWFVFLVTAANIAFLVAFTLERSHLWYDPGWLPMLFFPAFGVGFPVLLEFLLKRQQANRALRLAWIGLEDIVFEHVSSMVHWYRCSLQKTGAAPGYGDFDRVSEGFYEDLHDALAEWPVPVRLALRRDLGKLRVTPFLWGRLGEAAPGNVVPFLEERIYCELHSRYVNRLRPDLSSTVVMVLIWNLVSWQLVW